MATWAPLRTLLSDVDDSITLTWTELDELVGGLPASATQYREFWAGDRSGWPGFRTKNVQVGRRVTFQRANHAPSPARGPRRHGSVGSSARALSGDDELVLRAVAATGIADREALVREGLEALIRLASARKLAALGGSDPDASAAPRGRAVRP